MFLFFFAKQYYREIYFICFLYDLYSKITQEMHT